MNNMKLTNYIKTDDMVVISDFIKLCEEYNIPISEENGEILDSEDKIYGVGIFVDVPTITDYIVDLNVCVYLLTEKPASFEAKWWNKLGNYEKFIKKFDKNEIIEFLNKKLKKTMIDYPQFTIGCEMVSDIDLEYGFYKKDWVPYILKGYCYSEVSNEWQPRTQKGYGDFEGFKVWDEKILSMDKKQIKKYRKQ